MTAKSLEERVRTAAIRQDEEKRGGTQHGGKEKRTKDKGAKKRWSKTRRGGGKQTPMQTYEGNKKKQGAKRKTTGKITKTNRQEME